MTEQELVSLKAEFDELEGKWRGLLGSTGEEVARDIRRVADLLLIEQERLVAEYIRETVSPWALVGSTEKIPLEKISKDGLALLLSNPEYISDGELLEILKLRLGDA